MDLSPRIRSKLGWIKVLLNPKVPYGSPVEEQPIDYTYIDQGVLHILAELGLPVRSPTPFMFDYAEVLGPSLPSHAKPDRFFNALVDLMIREWELWFGRKTFIDNFGHRASWQKTAEETFKQMARERGFQIYSQRDRRQEFWVLEAKWIIDSLVFKLRAIWDVMLAFVSEHVLGFQLQNKTLEEKRAELRRKADGESLTQVQQRLVEIFLAMTGDIDRLRAYRDAELHRIGRRFLGALEHEKTAEYVWDAWEMARKEHNRAREGLIVVLGVVLGEAI